MRGLGTERATRGVAVGGAPHLEELVLESGQTAEIEQVEDVRQPSFEKAQRDITVMCHLARNDAARQKDRTDRAAAHQARLDEEGSLDLVGGRGLRFKRGCDESS